MVVNDIEMYYEIRGEGQPLLLLHGGGGVGSNWELIFKEPPSGYRLIIPDLRGHGRSTNPARDFPNGMHGPIFGERTGQFVESALDFLRNEWAGQ